MFNVVHYGFALVFTVLGILTSTNPDTSIADMNSYYIMAVGFLILARLNERSTK